MNTNFINCLNALIEKTTGDCCPRATYIKTCEPIEVTVVGDSTGSVKVDTVVLCNEATNVWEYHTTVITDDVLPGVTTVEPTTVSCDDEAPDFERASYCDPATDTTHIVTAAFADDGSFTVISDVDTGAACQGVTISNTCLNPVPIETCPDNPLEVVIVGDSTGSVQVDVELVCNVDTGVYDAHETVVTDEVLPGVVTITPTAIACVAEPEPETTVDVEYVCNETTGFWDQIVVVTVDGVVTSETTTASTVACVDTEPETTVDVEYVCNATTGFWDYSVTTIVDGVPSTPVVTATTVVCDTLEPDYEEHRKCDPATNTVHLITSAIIGGVSTQISDVDLLEECGQCEQAETWCGREYETFFDNHSNGERPLGAVAYRQDQFEISLSFSDGTALSFTDNGGYASYPAQMDDWAVLLTALTGKTWARSLASADGNPNTPFGNYVATTDCCADDPVLLEVLAETVASPSAARVGRTFNLLAGTRITEEATYSRCQCCGKPATWYDTDGVEVAETDLLPCLSKSCDWPALPPKPEPSCAVDFTDAVCEIAPEVLDDDNNVVTPATVITSSVFLNFINCGGVTTVDAYTLDVDSNAVPHELAPGNFYGDCDTLEPLEEEPPACPPGTSFEQVEWTTKYFILDNSTWTGSPTPHLANNQNYEFTFTYDDGSTKIVQQSAGNVFGNFMAEARAALGCDVSGVCANHPNCSPAREQILADYGLAPDISELWANGWFIECGGCEAEVTRVEITAAVNPDYVGAFKEPTVHTSETKTAFRAVTCDGNFWKDCDGNDILAPLGACCASPSGSGSSSSALDNLVVECCSDSGSSDFCADQVIGQGGFDLLNQGVLPPTWTASNPGAANFNDALNCGTYNEPNSSIFELGAVSFSPTIPAGAVITSASICFSAVGSPPNDGSSFGVSLYQPSTDTAPYFTPSGANGYLIQEPGAPAAPPTPVLGIVLEAPLAGTATSQDYEMPIDLTTATTAELLTDLGVIISVAEDQNELSNLRLKLEWESEDCSEALQVKGCNDDNRDSLLESLLTEQQTTNELLQQLIDCFCGPCPTDSLGDPIGDQTICATEKLGADFNSNNPGEITHTAGSLYTGTGPLTAWIGTFTVTDSASNTFTVADGATATGLASGNTTQVSFTGEIEFVKNGETFRCPVTDKLISANTVIQ